MSRVRLCSHCTHHRKPLELSSIVVWESVILFPFTRDWHVKSSFSVCFARVCIQRGICGVNLEATSFFAHSRAFLLLFASLQLIEECAERDFSFFAYFGTFTQSCMTVSNCSRNALFCLTFRKLHTAHPPIKSRSSSAACLHGLARICHKKYSANFCAIWTHAYMYQGNKFLYQSGAKYSSCWEEFRKSERSCSIIDTRLRRLFQRNADQNAMQMQVQVTDGFLLAAMKRWTP